MLGRKLMKKIAYTLPDKVYLSMHYRWIFGRFPRWKNPRTYNEKLQWLKLYDRNPGYTQMVDKAAMKEFVRQWLGEDYTVPTLGVWDRPEDIDFESLPDRFVLKCNHDSGSVIICRDKSSFDREEAVAYLRRAMEHDYYREYREWPYVGVERKILAEPDLRASGESLPDYKVMCFCGEPKLIVLHQNREENHTMDFYDTQWNLTEIARAGKPRSGRTVPRPNQLEEMLALSARLSEGIPHLRVDWYICEGRLYLGELTFFNASGFGPFENPEDDLLLGSWIRLEAGERMGV